MNNKLWKLFNVKYKLLLVSVVNYQYDFCQMCLRPVRSEVTRPFVKTNSEGSDAVTKYEVLNENNMCALVELEPATGLCQDLRSDLIEMYYVKKNCFKIDSGSISFTDFYFFRSEAPDKMPPSFWIKHTNFGRSQVLTFLQNSTTGLPLY